MRPAAMLVSKVNFQITNDRCHHVRDTCRSNTAFRWAIADGITSTAITCDPAAMALSHGNCVTANTGA
jgi:hypothetical protein